MSPPADAFEIGLGSRLHRGDTKVCLHIVVKLLHMMGAVAQYNVQQLQHGDFAAVVRGDLSVIGIVVAAI